MMFKGDQEFPRVYLDIDGYNRKNPRRPRKESGRKYQSEYVENIDEEKLTLQAQDAAKEVKRWGEPVVLPAMSAKERRIIHISLQDDPELKTESEGDGRRKKVIISLK
jgi:spoIIIJ-associated protein